MILQTSYSFRTFDRRQKTPTILKLDNPRTTNYAWTGLFFKKGGYRLEKRTSTTISGKAQHLLRLSGHLFQILLNLSGGQNLRLVRNRLSEMSCKYATWKMESMFSLCIRYRWSENPWGQQSLTEVDLATCNYQHRS